MKICYLADAANVHTQKWATFFANRGHHVTVISFRPFDIPGVTVHHIRTPPGKVGYVLVAPRIGRLVRRLAPDLLHAHHATSYGFVGALSGFRPFFLSSWGSDVIWSPYQSKLFQWMVRYNFKRADCVTATSHFLAQATAQFCPPNTSVHVIPFGVDTQVFAPPNQQNSDRPPTIGIIKTLRPRYGIRELILAFRQIAANFPKARLMIVGGGEKQVELQSLVDRLNLSQSINLTGPIAHHRVPEYLHQFDIFVVPSLTNRESFGVAAVEASACGLPVVASNVGGLPEVVVDSKTGLLVPPGDVDALARAMTRLLDNPALRVDMGQAGREFVLQHYRWADNAALMDKLYREVTGV